MRFNTIMSDFEVMEFISWVRTVISDLHRSYETADERRRYGYISLMDSIITNVVRRELVPSANSVVESLTQLQEAMLNARSPSSEQASGMSLTGRPGRPQFDVTAAQLEHLVGFGFRVPDISRLLGISERTVRRRLAEYGLSTRVTYSEISDEDLITLVGEVKNSFPTCGEMMLDGHLRTRGVTVQRHRLRSALGTVDCEGVALRFRLPVLRREYNVRSPNSLWHIDGYHKLIRWRLVIHGGIDGYTRIPVYLSCSSNNRAETVFRMFQNAVIEYGLPSRVRSDRGGENVLVKRFMEEHPRRGRQRGSMLMGRSVHNQRIERFWRDLFTGCTCLYYNLFHHLEDHRILNPCNATDLFCLHYTFLPRINHQLKTFADGCNRHRIRTARHQTPLQLWIRGMLERRYCGDRVTDKLYGEDGEAMSEFGIDWDGPVPSSIEDDAHERETVEVPEEECVLLQEELAELESNIDPMAESSFHGIDIYLGTMQFVEDKLVRRQP